MEADKLEKPLLEILPSLPLRHSRPLAMPARNAADSQRALLDKLFVDPSKEVKLDGLQGPKKKEIAPARDMIPNVQGSSAGAGQPMFSANARRSCSEIALLFECL